MQTKRFTYGNKVNPNGAIHLIAGALRVDIPPLEIL
jgi:hypothetical protein